MTIPLIPNFIGQKWAHDFFSTPWAKNSGALLSRKQVIFLFALAVAIRLAYIGLVLALEGYIDNGSDSGKYIKRAISLLEHGEMVLLNFGALGPDSARMPVYPYFLAGVFQLFGEDRLWIVSTIQTLIDTSTVFAVGLIAGAIDRRWAFPAAALACVWSTLVIFSSQVLTDTVFTSFLCWGLCACVWSPSSRHRQWLLIAAGVAFSFAMLTRPTLMFFPYFLVPLLGYLLWARSSLRWSRAFMFAAIPAIMITLVVVPRMITNNTHFGSPVLTTQSGNHAMDVVMQFVRLCPDCAASDMENRMLAEVAARMSGKSEADRKNPVILDQARRSVAFKYIQKIPVTVMIRGTVNASLRSILQTGLYETGHQIRLNPQYFSAVQGQTFKARLVGFKAALLEDRFLLLWSIAQATAIGVVILQLIGAIGCTLNRGTRPQVIFLLAVATYFLALNGPFGSPKYGMPLTPALIVITVGGAFTLLNILRLRQQPTSGNLDREVTK